MGWPVPICECGSRRSAGRDCCDRCRYLDSGGLRPSVAEVVWALRVADGCSLLELVEASGRAEATLRQTLRSLECRGRVAKRMTETDGSYEYRYFLADRG